MKIARIICCELDSTLRPTIKRGFDIIPAQPELILDGQLLTKNTYLPTVRVELTTLCRNRVFGRPRLTPLSYFL